jgi:hypothetical protein
MRGFETPEVAIAVNDNVGDDFINLTTGDLRREQP